jgi:hypothetical protein
VDEKVLELLKTAVDTAKESMRLAKECHQECLRMRADVNEALRGMGEAIKRIAPKDPPEAWRGEGT